MMVAPTIFQVEDDEDFAFFMECAVREINAAISLTIAPNAIDAIALLNKYQENSRMPGVIILDINLPGTSGLDLLKSIREIPFYEEVPIVIFSTSDNPKDTKTAFEFGASDFETKPMGYRELVNRLKIMHNKYIHA